MAHKAISLTIPLFKPSRHILPSLSLPLSLPTAPPPSIHPRPPPRHRSICTTQPPRKHHKPPPHTRPLTTPAAAAHAKAEPASISLDEYHRLSDTYIDSLVARLEELQEQREDVDVEYAAGVLTLLLPPHGTYVLNKQPPNKQIWLSSPVSGPKRYDWVAAGAGDDGGAGAWVYLRDGSTLGGLLEEEVGVVRGEEG